MPKYLFHGLYTPGGGCDPIPSPSPSQGEGWLQGSREGVNFGDCGADKKGAVEAT